MLASPGLGLGCALLDLGCHQSPGVADGDGLGLKIHIGSAQTQKLTTPES
jgi:hypothetical protein